MHLLPFKSSDLGALPGTAFFYIDRVVLPTGSELTVALAAQHLSQGQWGTPAYVFILSTANGPELCPWITQIQQEKLIQLPDPFTLLARLPEVLRTQAAAQEASFQERLDELAAISA